MVKLKLEVTINMGNESKIKKYNLEDEVNQLSEMGYSYDEIIGTLKSNHPKISDLQNLSKMSLTRYFQGLRERDIEDKLEEGKDPVRDLTEEYRSYIRTLLHRGETLYDKSIKILESVEDSEDNDKKMRAVKGATESLNQLHKMLNSYKQFGEKRTQAIYNVNLKKEVHVKNLLMNFAKSLCPTCKAKLSDILDEDS